MRYTLGSDWFEIFFFPASDQMVTAELRLVDRIFHSETVSLCCLDHKCDDEGAALYRMKVISIVALTITSHF